MPAWADAQPVVHNSRGRAGTADPGASTDARSTPRSAELPASAPGDSRHLRPEAAGEPGAEDAGGRERGDTRASEVPASDGGTSPPNELAEGAPRFTPSAVNESPGALDELDEEEIRRQVRDLLRALEGEPETAEEAYTGLCTVDERLIPRLIEYVESERPTQLERLELVVLQKDFSRYDAETGTFVYHIEGLRPLLLDDIGAGRRKIGRYRGATRVRITRLDGFPLGVVIRAGLLTRIKGERFPPYSSERGLQRWWRDYYRLAVAS